jgi:hypothetical protein
MSEYHPYRKAHPHSRLLTIEAVLFLAFVVFLFLLVGYTTNASPGAVLLGFMPSLLFGIVAIILVETDHFQPTYSWLVLVMVLVIASVVYFMVPSPAVQGIDAGTMLVLNGVLMIVALFIMQNSYVHERPMSHEEIKTHQEREKHERERKVEHTVHHVHHVEQPKDVTELVSSIEDKVKALNFVIGRVYSVYHGGTDRLRHKIRIDKLWYNDFTTIPEQDLEKRRHEAIVLIQKIKDRLELLQKTEREIFGDDISTIRNIGHDPAGGDKIITVLIKNDKDPVQQYYEGALSFCVEALNTLRADAPVSHGVPPRVPPAPKFAADTSSLTE